MLAALPNHFGAGLREFRGMRLQALSDSPFSRFDARAELFHILGAGLSHAMAPKAFFLSPCSRTAGRLGRNSGLVLASCRCWIGCRPGGFIEAKQLDRQSAQDHNPHRLS